MSTRVSSRKRNKHPELVTRVHELPRDQLVEIYRANAMRTVRDIRHGIVNEEDIDKLQNFIQTALALMQKVPVEVFRQSQRNAEIIGFISGKDTSVVLDPKKQAAVIDGQPVYSLSTLVEHVPSASLVKTVVEAVPEAELDAAIEVARALDEIFTTPSLLITQTKDPA